MVKIKYVVSVVGILCIPALICAQKNSGIQWTNALNWQQVKSMAKSENKYIFLDCYATWCGPCKEMDREVYSVDSVGQYFNLNFISVKVQMDKTDKDSPRIVGWYKDVDLLAQAYHVYRFPTYLFLSPDGVIVEKEAGFKTIPDFVNLAKVAVTPGKVYENPYSEYDRLVAEYRMGNRNFERIPYMLKAALRVFDTSMAKSLAKDYNSYVKSLPEKEWYTKENIEFFSLILTSKSKYFPLFFPDGRKIDSVMGIKGYAFSVVDQIIKREDVEPFLKAREEAVQQMDSVSAKKCDSEWKPLFTLLKTKYNYWYSKRELLDAKVVYFERRNNTIYFKYFIQMWRQYYRREVEGGGLELRLNNVAWDIFERSTKKHQSKVALRWMSGVVKRANRTASDGKPGWWCGQVMDTYANLLYKEENSNKKALYWEGQAILFSPNEHDFSSRLSKMQAGQQTW